MNPTDIMLSEKARHQRLYSAKFHLNSVQKRVECVCVVLEARRVTSLDGALTESDSNGAAANAPKLHLSAGSTAQIFI